MTDSPFVPTLEQRTNLSFAYLAGLGAKLTCKEVDAVSLDIYAMMKDAMPQISPLLNEGVLDWEIVWGPVIYTFSGAKFQDNLMYVVKQISKPSNYVIAIRGTNGPALWDWIIEDLEVWTKVPWSVPSGVHYSGSPMISKATQNGIDVLLNKLIPMAGVPGFGQNITTFLSGLVTSQVNLVFVGHSLGGALSPTLALWFKQSQKLVDGWDPQGNAKISTMPTAGPTAGNRDFAAFFNQQLGDACDRIHNTLDMVPHAWETGTMWQLPWLYKPTAKMSGILKLIWLFATLTVSGYKQISTGNPITGTIQTGKTNYLAQALYQHVVAYPILFQVPELQPVINATNEKFGN